MIAGSYLSIRLARSLVKDERIYQFALAVFVGGLAAARIGHIADNWPYYSTRPDQLLAIWNGGVAVTPPPIGSAIGGGLVPRRPPPPPRPSSYPTLLPVLLLRVRGPVRQLIIRRHHPDHVALLS